MKPFYTLVFSACSFFVMVHLAAQTPTTTFAPIGAEWHNSHISSFFSPPTSFMRSVVSRDSVINGITFQVIEKYKETGASSTLYRTDYVRTIGDKVERLADDGFLYTLYDFSLAVGDTFITKTYDHYAGQDVAIAHVVYAVSTVTINGQVLRTQEVTTLGRADGTTGFHMSFNHGAGARIIERIGNEWYIFPQDYGFWDSNITTGLRCYSDLNFTLYETGLTSTCDFITTSTEEIATEIELTISPTLASGQIQIDWAASTQIIRIELFNSTGQRTRRVSSEIEGSNNFSLSLNDQGLHIIRLTLDDGRSISQKVMNF